MGESPDHLPRGYDGRRTSKALALALVLLAVLEIAFRAVAPQISGNLAHIREFDALRSELAVQPGSKAVIIGNSLTNNAIQVTYFSELATSYSGQSIHAVKFVPDGTTLLDWRCVIDRLPPTSRNDLLLIGYAWNQVTDQQRVSIDRTFGLLCPLALLPTASRWHGIGIGGWIEAGMAKLSLIYVLRERIRNGVLGVIVPHYEAEMQRMNDRARIDSDLDLHRQPHRTYGSLSAALDRAKELGYQPVVIAMPTLHAYTADPALPRTVKDMGAGFIDLRHEPWLRDDLFLDSIHLGPEGAHLFTRSLATQIYGHTLAGGRPRALSLAR